MKRPTAAFMVVLALAVIAGRADALTLYVRRAIVAMPGDLAIAALVQASGEVSAELQEKLNRSVAVVSDRALLIPASLYRGLFEDGASGNLILVGNRTLVAPQGSPIESALPLLDKLVDYLAGEGGLGNGRVEIEVVKIAGVPSDMPSTDPIFQTVRVEKKAGLISGAAEFGFRFSGGEPGLAGRILLRISQEAVETAHATAVVKANDSVSVSFRKGAILIEMPGKALSSAAEGEPVSVYVSESRLSFQGVAVGNKAVSVEIP